MAWGSVSDSAAPLKSAPPSLLQPKAATTTTTTGTISCAFQLPAEQQRRSIASISLAECLQRVMKQTEAVVEACTSGQSKAISFVIRGSQQQVTLAKRMIWSELAQNVSADDSSVFKVILLIHRYCCRAQLSFKSRKKRLNSSLAQPVAPFTASNTTSPSAFKFPKPPTGKAL